MNVRTRRATLRRSMAAAATLAAGFGVAWGMVAVWICTTALGTGRGGSGARVERFAVMTDGTPLIQSYPLDNYSLMTYRELDGRARDVAEQGDLLQPAYLYGTSPDAIPPGIRDWHGRIGVYVDERNPTAAWYFVHDGAAAGSGAFVGFERGSNRPLGTIGPDGPGGRFPVGAAAMGGAQSWTSMPLSVYSFGGNWRPRPGPGDVPPRLVHIPVGNQLWVVDLAARAARVVFEAPGPIDSVGVPPLASYAGGRDRAERPIAVRVGPTVYRLDRSHRVVGTVALPPEIDRGTPLTWYETEGGRAVIQCHQPTGPDEPTGDALQRSTVYRVAADGSIRGPDRVALRSMPGTPSQGAQLALMALGLPEPAALFGIEYAFAPGGRLRSPVDLLRRNWPAWGSVLALAAVLAALAWRRGRAFGLPGRERAAWAAFVLAFGLPAFVGYLLHRRWPPREPCPQCRKPAARDRDACPNCGAPIAAPEPLGIEIFA